MEHLDAIENTFTVNEKPLNPVRVVNAGVLD